MADELIAGRYRLLDEVGRGASATVFRAEDTVLGRTVALKAVSASLLSDPTFMERFNAEARLAARLDHPGIVTVYDVGTFDDGRPFISMKLIEGQPLNQYMESRPGLSRRERVQVLAQVANALDYIHDRGLVHRDVKPANILVDAEGRATVMDFGIAVAIDSARVTLTGMTVGTPRYMSPEQVQGHESTRSTDIYALGVIAFEVLGGLPPFEGSGTSLMYRIVNEQPPQLSAFDSGIGAAAETVVASALAKDPAQRWPTAGQFIQALLGAVPEGPPVAPVDPYGTQTVAPVARPPTSDEVDTFDRMQALPHQQPPRQQAPSQQAMPAAGVPATPAPVSDPVPGSPRPAASGAGGSGGEGRAHRATSGDNGGSRRGVMLAVGGAVALAVGLAGGAIFALSGGNGGGAGGEETATPTASQTTTRTAIPTRTTPGGGPTATNTRPPTATATPTFRWSQITGISTTGANYSIDYITGNFEPALPDAMHVHFFFDTVPPTQAGTPGSGPWRLYGGPSPFTEYPISERLPGATQMCILVANPDHSVIQGTGNCVALP